MYRSEVGKAGSNCYAIVSRYKCELSLNSSTVYSVTSVTQNVLEYVRFRLNVLDLAEVYRYSCKLARTIHRGPVGCLLELKAFVDRAVWVLMTLHPIAVEIILPE